MAIVASDIRLLKSQRVTDNGDGGGMMTGNEVVDGESNNLFDDVSSLDRLSGDLSLRKVYLAVVSANNESYYGSHLIISDLPASDSVHVAMFSTDSWSDTRSDVDEMNHRFYGAARLAVAANSGDLSIAISTRKAAVSPQIISEVSSSSISYSSAQPHYLSLGGSHGVDTTIQMIQGQEDLYIYNPDKALLPGSFRMLFRPLFAGTTVYHIEDDSLGNLVLVSSLGRVGLAAGVIDYETGAIRLNFSAPWLTAESLFVTIVCEPVIFMQNGWRSESIAISSANRKLVYQVQLSSTPAGSSMEVVYRSNDSWLRLFSVPGNVLVGAGSGVINTSTNDVTVTLDGMPDEGTDIIITWADDGGLVQRELEAILPPRIIVDLPHSNVVADSVSVTFTVDDQVVVLSDDNAGELIGGYITAGSVDYVAGSLWFDPQRAPDVSVMMMVAYTVGSVNHSVSVPAILTLDINPSSSDEVYPGSIRLELAGDYFYDDDGLLYRYSGLTSGVGVLSGSVDYVAGVAVIEGYSEGPFYYGYSGVGPFTAVSSLYTYDVQLDWTLSSVVFRISVLELKPGSITVSVLRASDQAQLSVTDNGAGLFVSAGISGSVDYSTSTVKLTFTDPVVPSSIVYDYVAYQSLNPNSLVPIFQEGDVLVVHHSASQVMPSGLSANQSVNIVRSNLASCVLFDQGGVIVATDQYAVDLVAGVLTMSGVIDLSSYSQPLMAVHKIEEMALSGEVSTNNQITLISPLSRGFPAVDTIISSALVFNDLTARIESLFDQETWTGEWANTAVSSPIADAQYNSVSYPIDIKNDGSITERWALVFSSGSTFRVIGETLGEIAVGDTATPLSPVNPATGQPYFHINPLGWGNGWGGGNVLRFNTVGANHPVWISRVINPGASQAGDQFSIEKRGDVNA